MALYAYIKAKPQHVLPISCSHQFHLISKLMSTAFFLAGLFLIGQVVAPIVGWYLFVLPTYKTAPVSPLASNFKPEYSPIFPAVVRADEQAASSRVSNSYDTSTWFVGAKQPEQRQVNLKTYTLTIPKLRVNSATVEIGGEDLKKSLIAWPTSGLPGAYGNAVIFGHSALPQISTPTNYSTIFTFLMDLNEGDEIFVDSDRVRYKYIVVDKKVVEPDDLSVLEQRYDASYITLITCVPPGTTWKRGVVLSRLVNY